MKTIDSFLNSITMYRLVLYYLILLIGVAAVYCFLGILPYNPLSLLLSTAIIVCVSWITNTVFAKVFHAPTNVESVYISALILALIISPMKSLNDVPLLVWASVLTMASKYILAINKKHIFNPVAVGVALTAFGFGGSASWWVGTFSMAPFVLLGFLIVRKIKRYDMLFYYFFATLVTVFYFTVMKGNNLSAVLYKTIFSSSLLFFAVVMLTEPLTTPPTKTLQVWYGIIVGILFAPQFHIGSFSTTPELALVYGNIFSYLVSPKDKIITTLKEKIQTAPNMFDFLFVPEKKLTFKPGQYMEWTLQHPNTDSRGNRRYFTIASSPTEKKLRLGVKFYPNGSSYKKAMLSMDETTSIVGAQLSGDFTMPKDSHKKLVFIAGGIGVTPFRSMIKYLVDIKQKRDIVMFYSNKTKDEIMYSDVFQQAHAELDIRTIYTLTDSENVPADWNGNVGRIDRSLILQEVPDFMERTFYISGTHSLIESSEKILIAMGVPSKHIMTDFFPGFA